MRNKEDYLKLLLQHKPLARWRAVRTVLRREYGLGQGVFELLMELHEVEYFTTEDFKNGTLLLNWDKNRWYDMLNGGWIELYRERDGVKQRYNIYQLTRKTLTMARKAYGIIASTELLPSKVFSKKMKYSEKLQNLKVNQLNELKQK